MKHLLKNIVTIAVFTQLIAGIARADMLFCWCTAYGPEGMQQWELPTEEGSDCDQAKANAQSDCDNQATEKGLNFPDVNTCSGPASNSC